MAAILAHEVKNPLSGIRGAAQLLEQGCSVEDRTLTRLICDEADRIVALVDRMEVFSDKRPIQRNAVNIHSVLEHVRRIAQAGFGRHVRFSESYDPSLPSVFGNRDQLDSGLPQFGEERLRSGAGRGWRNHSLDLVPAQRAPGIAWQRRAAASASGGQRAG